MNTPLKGQVDKALFESPSLEVLLRIKPVINNEDTEESWFLKESTQVTDLKTCKDTWLTPQTAQKPRT